MDASEVSTADVEVEYRQRRRHS